MASDDAISAWLQRVKQGEKDAFAPIFEHCYETLLGAAKHRFGNRERACGADDAVQMAMATFFRRAVADLEPSLDPAMPQSP